MIRSNDEPVAHARRPSSNVDMGASNSVVTLNSLAQTFEGDASVRAVPFDAIDLDLPVLWGPRRDPR